MVSTLDLRQLSVDRESPKTGSAGPPRRVLSRYVLPLAVLAGFVVVIGWAARDTFLPSKPVTVVPVIVSRAEVQQAGTLLFRAAGWIEPRPTPVLVTALTEGVVDQLLVVEGQKVQAGQELARLLDADARIALGQAEAELQLREAEASSAIAAKEAAQAVFEQPVQLESALAEVESAHAKVDRELVNLPFALRAAAARLELAQKNLEGKRSAGQAVSGRALQEAENDHLAATAAVEELKARKPALEREVAALDRQREALATQLRLKIAEHRAVAEAKAAVRAAEARVKQAQYSLDAAKLRMDRMIVRSPVAGRVLALHAAPGERLMGMDASSHADSSTLVSLYNPGMLQVRADVRLEDMPHVQSGQPVTIETAAFKGNLKGEVLTATSTADIQKNTLQVKIAIEDPPPVITPEMLVQVSFMAPEQPESASEGAEEPLRLLIPKELVQDSADGAYVWIADRVNMIARRQAIQVGLASKGELVEVVDGLSAMDRLISGGREGLEDGDRISISGEDAALGLASQQ